MAAIRKDGTFLCSGRGIVSLAASVARSRSRSLPVAARSQAFYLDEMATSARSQQLLHIFFGRCRSQVRSQTLCKGKTR